MTPEFKVDFERGARIGLDEALFCESKTVDQISAIVDDVKAKTGRLLLTRLDGSKCSRATAPSSNSIPFHAPPFLANLTARYSRRRDRRRDHRRYKSFRRLRIDRRLSGRRDLHWHSWIRSSGHGTVDQHPGGHQGRDHNSGGVSEPTVAGYAPRRFWFSESNRTARKITAPWMN